MVNEELGGTDMIGELLGKRQRPTHQAGNRLSQHVVETLNMVGFTRQLGDGAGGVCSLR
jgi:hypothetical protein